ncbi:PREDICTED: 28S ribosomal protein S30, mitochondrial isoform X2 [Habropoda laboriosa]|uniref:28S ribosomal protein S30, mitochondrial isoform X2 n=1 Tax=Habropoda laboriosa TaxID=597456 RepID=UPI00083D04DA|nr:PREDICTED: 28S ribosomal protein S30, mitochondrial isoform X2 [Habropoda laboriosa]
MYTGLRKPFSNCSVSALKAVIRKYTSTALCETDNVIYPPIMDLSRKASIKRKHEEWYEKIKKLNTVEEKLFGINMPRYYGWKSLMLEEGKVPYNSLHHAQYITHTHVVNNGKLPEFYDTVISTEQMDALIETVKRHIENVITFEYCSSLEHKVADQLEEERKKILEDEITKALVYQINRIILATLSSNTPHLFEAEIDFEPRVEAFWFVGGIERPTLSSKATENPDCTKEHASEPINMPVQYYGSPILQLRHLLPLKEILSLTESSNPDLSIPEFKFDPRVLGYRLSHKHATCIPGFWPGDPAEFGLLSYHNLNEVYSDTRNVDDDAITVQAIYASYGWLLSQACYQGFSMGNDLTYPLVSQTVLTNGKFWSFCAYQLNTIMLHLDYPDENCKRNMCWITEPMKLFDTVENGEIQGFNEDVLRKLIRFYMNIPVERTNVNMKPYLGESVKHVADIADPERRSWLETRFKHITSNRPRHFKQPQIYHWQKIYMIDNDTRPLDKKRDPWQFGYNASKRRMDDHLPIYVPKYLRENPKKKKSGRWAKTYYPDA